MRLSDLYSALLPYTISSGSSAMATASYAEVEVQCITSDSRHVQPGCLFVALPGSNTDGHQYIQKAIDSGAVALVVQTDRLVRYPLPLNTVPVIEVPKSFQAFAILNSAIRNFPAHQLRLIGVTGTNGKTTVTHLIEKILVTAQYAVGLIGTLGTRKATLKENVQASASSPYDSTSHTTPMADELQAMLADMRQNNTEFVALEVSSHALDQDRTAGCRFEVAVFTNLTQDHLDYHKTMEHYCQAKAKLFQALDPLHGKPVAVINADDPYAKRMQAACPEGVQQVLYGIDAEEVTVRAQNVTYSIEGAGFYVLSPWGTAQVQLQIAGRFSIYNALAALSTGLALGIPMETCVKAVESVQGVRGRFEVVANQPYVIVDYAHTPDGLENVLSAARMVTPEGGKLIAVFGCGGDRDATKRPKMGHIAERLADILVVTSDNPRSEDPQQIITDVVSGIVRFDSQRMLVHADRRSAIRQAIDLAQPEDVIVVAGKGHEDYQILATQTIHFDDREEVQRYLQERSASSALSINA